MELRHLRYFLAVAETENVRLASERLHVTQPAVSRQIHDLEEELGVQLFERLPRGLRLTRERHAYRTDAMAVMASLDTARNRVRGIAGGETGLLRVGYVEVTAWRGVVPETLRAFRAFAPGVRLELTPMGTPEQLELINRETLDGGFVYLFDKPCKKVKYGRRRENMDDPFKVTGGPGFCCWAAVNPMFSRCPSDAFRASATQHP